MFFQVIAVTGKFEKYYSASTDLARNFQVFINYRDSNPKKSKKYMPEYEQILTVVRLAQFL